MPKYNNEIYNLKIYVISLICLILSLIAISIDNSLCSTDKELWWCYIPFKGFGEALFTSGIIVFAFDKYLRSQTDNNIENLITENFKSLSNNFYLDVLKEPDKYTKIIDEDYLENVLKNSLSTFLNSDLSDALYNQYIKNNYKSNEIWSDYYFKATLATAKLNHNAVTTSQIQKNLFYNDFFEVYIEIKYKTKFPKNSFKFVCSRNNIDHDKYMSKHDFTWLVPLDPKIHKVDKNIFEVTEFKIDSIAYKVEQNSIDSIEFLEVKNINIEDPDKLVSVFYKIKTYIKKIGHHLFVNVVVPTRQASFEIDYSDTTISYLNIANLLSSSTIPEFHFRPQGDQDHSRKAEINSDGWVYPGSGVCFVWVFKEEDDLQIG